MKKRLAAALLWFYTGWYAGALIAYAVGAPELIGPVIGAVGAAIFAGDPRGIIWRRAANPKRALIVERI